MLRVVPIIALAAALSAHAADRPRVNHLIPWAYGFDSDLRPLLDKKILLTPANCGRMIRMHQAPEIGESAVSVYCGNGRCSVTVTGAARNLDFLWNNNRGQRDQVTSVTSVPVTRKEAEIPQSTAYAFRECWRAALKATSEREDERTIVLDNDRVEFWLIEKRSAPLRAERPDFPGKDVERLISIGDQLAHYCEMSPSRRIATAKHIEREALRLQQVFARQKASNRAIQPTAR